MLCFNNYRQTSGTGFTLVELLVSMSIFAFLTLVTFTAFSQERTRAATKRSADQLAVNLQEMQNSAQSGVVVPGDTVRAPGFGVFFDTTTNNRYTLFADTGATPNQYDPGSDRVLRTITLPNNVILYKMVDQADTITSQLTYVYQSPNAQTVMTASNVLFSPSTSTATIVLRDIKLYVCYIVVIHRLTGLINKRQLSSSALCV